MPNPPSFQDLLADFSDEIFVGRSEQIALFEKALTAARAPFLILDVSGQGGVGKTTLLEQFRRVAGQHKAFTALTNEDQSSIPTVLNRFAKDFAEADHPCKTFEERYRKYRELKEQVEADPKAPTSMLDFALRSVTRIGLRSLKRIPVAGEAADVLFTPEAEDALVENTSAFANYVAQKFANKDERVLLLETESELTRHFLTDLDKHANEKRVILFFDTFEKTASALESWLVDLLGGKFDAFSGNVLFIIAGRYPLGQPWTKFKKAIKQVELEEFTEAETRDYLTRNNITDQKQVIAMMTLSNRLPVLLALLVSAPGEMPADMSGDAVERFLQGATPEQREAALAASVPRLFNQDILAVILGPDAAKSAFEWLSEAHFVRASERGWAYHDVVRSLMLRYLRMRSAHQCTELHSKLAEHYRKRGAEGRGATENEQQGNEIWQQSEAERLYHRLSEDHLSSLKEVLAGFISDYDGQKSTHQTYTQILEQVSNEINDSRNLKTWAIWLKQLISLPEENASTNELQECISAATALCDFQELDNHHRSLAFSIRGQVQLEAKKRAAASADFGESIKLDPDSSNAHYLRGIKYLLSDEPSSALASFTKAIELRPNSSRYYQKRGVAFYYLDRFGEALDDFSQAIKLEPNSSMSFSSRGETHRMMKNYPAALSDFTKVIELQPENGAHYNLRGVVYWDMENHPVALSDFTRAIELQSDNSQYRSNRAHTYWKVKNYPDALVDFNKAIELQQANSDFYNWREMVYLEMEGSPSAPAHFTKALADAAKAVAVQPDDGSGYLWRGRLYLSAKNYLGALADFAKYIELKPRDNNGYRWRGIVYFKMENYSAALVEFNKAIEFSHRDAYSYYNRGHTYRMMNSHHTAIDDFSTAIDLQSKNADFYYWRGRTYYDLANYTEAATDFFNATQYERNNSDYYSWRGLTHRELRNYSSALIAFSTAIELQPENGASYYWRGRTYYDLKNYLAALADLNKFMEYESENGYGFQLYGVIYYSIQNYSAASIHFTKAIELLPENSHNYYWRGLTHYDLKDYPAALADLNKAIELQPENGNNYYWRGCTYYHLKDYPAALADLTKANELLPENGNNYYWRGRTHYQLKDYPAALADLNKAIELQLENGYNFAWRGRVYLALNNLPNTEADFAQVESFLKNDEGWPAYYVSGGYALLSQITEACIWLRRAFERDKSLVNEALTDSDFDPIREMEEFKKLMEEFGSDEKSTD